MDQQKDHFNAYYVYRHVIPVCLIYRLLYGLSDQTLVEHGIHNLDNTGKGRIEKISIPPADRMLDERMVSGAMVYRRKTVRSLTSHSGISAFRNF